MANRKKRTERNSFALVPSCHYGPVEVIKNLFCGSMAESFSMASAPIRVDTLVPLHDLGAAARDAGFRGEVLHYPIRDYRTLPDAVLDDVVSKILDRLSGGKKVGIFCEGGHGRTGYIASVVLGRLGYDDPIHFLRTKYCRKAVESSAQVQHIADVLGKPELVERYDEFSVGGVSLRGFGFNCADFYDLRDFVMMPANATCGECARRRDKICQIYGVHVDGGEWACDDFSLKMND